MYRVNLIEGPSNIMARPNVLILRAPGANCDAETQYAFELAGGLPQRIHINRLRENPRLLHDFHILVIPGGFTYGDDVAAGKILACQLTHFLGDALRAFRDQDKLILGICNGFQVLLKAGLIVPPDEDGPVATLTANDRGFLDRWITLKARPGKCPFLKGYDRFQLPVAHGEGKFVCRLKWILEGLDQAGQIILNYVDGTGQPGGFPINPNGSQKDLAGLCDVTGHVLGLMPHPERHVLPTQHPQWTRRGLRPKAMVYSLFRNAVEYFA